MGDVGEALAGPILGIVGGVIGTLIMPGIGTAIGAGIGFGVGVGYTMSRMMPDDIPQLPSVGTASPTYTSIEPINTTQEGIPVPRAYGYCELGGNILRQNSSSDADQRVIVGHCQGSVSQILTTTVNDEVWDTIQGNPTRNYYSGTTTQFHDTRFSGVSSAYRGLAYSAFTFAKSNQTGGNPQILTMGRWMCCENTSGVSIWTNNPGIILYDWYKNVEGWDENALEKTYFDDLATYCQPDAGISGGTAIFRPALDGNTVTATTTANSDYFPFMSFSPKTSKTGGQLRNQWYAAVATNQRIQIDFGQPVIIDKMIIENAHRGAENTAFGMKNFDVRASNNSAAFANKTVGHVLWETAVFDNSGVSFQAAKHVASDVEDPQTFTWSNSTPYRYWAIQIKDNWGGEVVGVRKAEFYGHLNKRYTFDFVFDAKINKNDAKKVIWKSFNGCAIWSQGKIKPVWESAKDIAYSFTMDNIVHGSLTWGRPKKPNIIRINYKDAYDGNKKTCVELKDELSLKERGEILYEEDCWWINNSSTARRRLQFFFNKFQTLDYTCQLTGFPGSQGLEIFDRVTVTHTLPGWTAKDFIIKGKSEDELGRPAFLLEAYYSGIYDGEEAEPQSSYASALPAPFAIPSQVTGIVVTDISSWASDGYYIPKVRIEYDKPDNSLGWANANIYLSSDDTNYYFSGNDNSGGTGYVVGTSSFGVEAGATVYAKVLSVNAKGIEALNNENAATKAFYIGLPDIQTAFDNAPIEGGIFILPKGRFSLSSAVSVPDKPIHLGGANEDTILENAANKTLFDLYNKTKEFIFDGFTISSQNTSSGCSLFDIHGSVAANNTARIQINQLIFNLYDNGSPLDGSGDIGISYQNGTEGSLYIASNKIINGARAIFVYNCPNVWIITNIMDNQKGYCIYGEGGENVYGIGANKITNQRLCGIFLISTANHIAVYSNLISSINTGVNAQFIGMYYQFDNGQVTQNTVKINTSSTTTTVIGISSQLAGVNVKLNDNIVEIDVNTGAPAYGLSVDNDYSLISNNNIKVSNANIVWNQYGIFSSGSTCQISGNQIDMVNSRATDIALRLNPVASANDGNQNLVSRCGVGLSDAGVNNTVSVRTV